MHVTTDSPLTDRAAVMLANAVMYAGQDHPDPDAVPALFTLHDMTTWAPTAEEWRQVCETVTLITSEYDSNTLVSLVHRGLAGGGPDAALDDLVLLDHWHYADPLARAVVVLRLAWEARTGPCVAHEGAVFDSASLSLARSLQERARTHWHASGDMLTWFGGNRFPAVWPDHEAAVRVRRLVEEEDGDTVASLHVALLLAGGAR